MRNQSWYESADPRIVRSRLNAQRSVAKSAVASITDLASEEYQQQIEAGRATLGDKAENLNYVPSQDVTEGLSEVDTILDSISLTVACGPIKTQTSGLDASLNTQAIRHGQF